MHNPPQTLHVAKRAGYFVAGAIPGTLAFGAAIVDGALHAMGMPHGFFLHGPLTALTLAAIVPLDMAWRGYSVSGRGAMTTIYSVSMAAIRGTHMQSMRNPYSGNGYPLSGTTYARENLNGRYGQGVVMRGISTLVLYVFAPLAHIAESGIRHAGNVSREIWSRPKTFPLPFEVLSHITESAIVGGFTGLTKGIPEGLTKYTKDVAEGNLMNRSDREK